MQLNMKIVLFIVKIYIKITQKYVELDRACTKSIAIYQANHKYWFERAWFCLSQQWLILIILQNTISPNPKMHWKLNRMGQFWEIDCQCNGEEFFKSNFRMKRSSFNKLCALLSTMEKKDTHFHKAISLEKRVAIGLYSLGSSAEYRSIANIFGIGKSTVCTIVLEFCKKTWNALQPMYLNYFPLSRDTIVDCVAGFNQMGFPQCIGAIDGCHIEVHPRHDEAVDYYNYKGWYSTVLLALVDARYRFLYINVGTPGRCNDSYIYERSLLKKELESSSLIDEMSVNLESTNIPILILSDSAFRLSRNVMKPFPFNLNHTPAEKKFNYQLSKCRRVAENGFGHIKARFRRIGKGIDNSIQNVNCIIQACCVLHNFLIEERDDLPRIWLHEQGLIDGNRNYPNYTTNRRNNGNEGDRIRHALSLYFARTFDDDGNSGGNGEGAEGGEGGDDSLDDCEYDAAGERFDTTNGSIIP